MMIFIKPNSRGIGTTTTIDEFLRIVSEVDNDQKF